MQYEGSGVDLQILVPEVVVVLSAKDREAKDESRMRNEAVVMRETSLEAITLARQKATEKEDYSFEGPIAHWIARQWWVYI